MKYKLWLESVKRLLIRYKLINSTTILIEDFYKPYFEDDLNPIQAIKEDIGTPEINYNK